MELVRDFKNTYCSATQHSYDALVLIESVHTKYIRNTNTGFFGINLDHKSRSEEFSEWFYSFSAMKEQFNPREIVLLDGKFYYAEETTQQEINKVIDKQLAEETKSEIIVIGGGADVKRNIKRYLDKNKTYEITIKEVISNN